MSYADLLEKRFVIRRIIKEEENSCNASEVEREEDVWAYLKNLQKILRAVQKVRDHLWLPIHEELMGKRLQKLGIVCLLWFALRRR